MGGGGRHTHTHTAWKSCKPTVIYQTKEGRLIKSSVLLFTFKTSDDDHYVDDHDDEEEEDEDNDSDDDNDDSNDATYLNAHPLALSLIFSMCTSIKFQY
jgi:hypothetical protein